MRLSVRWIFDHIVQKLDLGSLDIKNLVHLLNKTTAEIESVEHITFNPQALIIVKIVEITDIFIKAYIPELDKKIDLPTRADAVIGSYYLVKKYEHGYDWTTAQDIGSEKTYLVPEVSYHDFWKNNLELDDYILMLDNKAISHRPDLWGHRGFAREVAALMDYNLKPLEDLMIDIPIKQHDGNKAHQGQFLMEIKNYPSQNILCDRFAGLHISKIHNQPSNFFIASRLMRVDAKPIDFIVDATNYVMFDMGQPMHAYDADRVASKQLVITQGFGDTLTLLDGTEIVIDAHDCAIYDGEQIGISNPIALAGIMGGKSTAVTLETASIFLEAAHFNASSIRHTSMRLKKRTEASARFEKSLDPNQNIDAIRRFLKLLTDHHISYQAQDAITSLGVPAREKAIKVQVDSIKKLLSLSVSSEMVQKILSKLGFGVVVRDSEYEIIVPTYRSTKDITISVDIIEEIGRFIGYDAIEPLMPPRVMSAFDIRSVQNIRTVKKHLAYGLHMNEAQSYAFYDEEFLDALNYDPGQTVEVINPQSSNWRRLITSLIPNLLKVVHLNKHKQELFRYFELNRIWRVLKPGSEHNVLQAIESFELAGVIGDHKYELDFYECKNLVNSIFELFNMEIKWQKSTSINLGLKKLEPWYYEYETAALVYDNQVLGLAGMVDARFLHNILPESKAFIFELNADFLVNSRPVFKKFVPLEKYPEVHIDISMFVPHHVAVHDVEKMLRSTHLSNAAVSITTVVLVDFFEKEEWGNKKSLTFRIGLYNESRTLIKSEVDQIYQQLVNQVKSMGGEIR